MSLALTITDHWEDGKRVHVTGTLTGGGTYATGGDTVPFNNPLIKSGSAPIWFQAQVGSYNCVGLPGAFLSTPPNAKLQIFVDTSGLELAAGAYPAALQVAGAINFYAIFPKHI